MLQPVIDISSQPASSMNTFSSVLVLQLGKSYIGYCIADEKTRVVHRWVVCNFTGSAIDALNELLHHHPNLSEKFAKTVFVTDFSPSEIVPYTLASDTVLDQILTHRMGDLSGYALMKQPLPERGAVCCFAIPHSLDVFLKSRFAEATVVHLHALWLQKVDVDKQAISVCFLYHQMHICIQRNAQLQLLQEYAFETPEDALYHILNAANTLHINLNDTTVILEGMIDQQSAMASKLQQYIPNIVWSIPEVDRFPDASSDYPPAFLAFQDRLISCVS